MNIKNNQRFQESEKKIQNALAELLKTEKVHNITVQDICNMSGVNRTTFYAHFSDIRELTERSEMQIREAAMMAFRKDCSVQQPSQKWQLFFLHCMKKHMNFYHLYFQCHKNEPALNGLAQIWLFDASVHLDHYRQAFYRGGIEAILRRWVEEGCADSPETVQTVLSQCLPENFL